MMAEPSSSCLRLVRATPGDHQNTQVMQGTSPCQRQPSLSQQSLQNRQPSTIARELAFLRGYPPVEVEPSGEASFAPELGVGGEVDDASPSPAPTLVEVVLVASASPALDAADEPEEVSLSLSPEPVVVEAVDSPPAALERRE